MTHRMALIIEFLYYYYKFYHCYVLENYSTKANKFKKIKLKTKIKIFILTK